jgi:hypothetical protein
MSDLAPTHAAVLSRLEARRNCVVPFGALAYAMMQVGHYSGLEDLREVISVLKAFDHRISEVKDRGYVVDALGQDSPRAPRVIT